MRLSLTDFAVVISIATSAVLLCSHASGSDGRSSLLVDGPVIITIEQVMYRIGNEPGNTNMATLGNTFLFSKGGMVVELSKGSAAHASSPVAGATVLLRPTITGRIEACYEQACYPADVATYNE